MTEKKFFTNSYIFILPLFIYLLQTYKKCKSSVVKKLSLLNFKFVHWGGFRLSFFIFCNIISFLKDYPSKIDRFLIFHKLNFEIHIIDQKGNDLKLPHWFCHKMSMNDVQKINLFNFFCIFSSSVKKMIKFTQTFLKKVKNLSCIDEAQGSQHLKS